MNLLDKLKKYFDETPREQVLADWEKSKDCDNVGPTIDEFLSHQNFIISNDKIEENDLIIDTEKFNVSINGENLFIPVKCKKILDENTLIWESLDGKSSACDDIFIFRKLKRNEK